MKTYHGLIKKLMPHEIFVFGSNTQGRHGAGAAKVALDMFGAIYGRSQGFQGQSYAICTKDLTKSVHPSVSRKDIIIQIGTLYGMATKVTKAKEFLIAYSGIGKNLNGYTPQEMAQMFLEAGEIPDNIVFEHKFAQLMGLID